MCFFKIKTVLLSVFFVSASFANDEFSTPHFKEKFLKICSEAKNFDEFLGVFPSLKKEKEEIESTAFFDSHYSATSWLIKHGITAQQCPIWISFFEQSVFDDPQIKKQFIERCKTAKTIEDFIKTFPSLKKVKEQFLDTAPSYLVLNYARSWIEDFVVKSEKCPIWEKLFIPKTIKLNTASKNAQYEISWHPKSDNINRFRKFKLKQLSQQVTEQSFVLDNPFSIEMEFGDSIVWEDYNFDNLEDFRLKGVAGAAQSRRFDVVFLQTKNGHFRFSRQLSELDTFEIDKENQTIRSRYVPSSYESKTEHWKWHNGNLKLIKTIDNLKAH